MSDTTNPKEIEFKEELNDILFTVFKKIQPARTLKESTTTFTTDEFVAKITAHFPSGFEISAEDIYKILKQNGFVYECVGNGSRLEWLAIA